MISIFINSALSNFEITVFNSQQIILSKNFSPRVSNSELFAYLKTIDLSEINSVFCVSGPGRFIGLRTSITISNILKYLYPNIRLYSIASIKYFKSLIDYNNLDSSTLILQQAGVNSLFANGELMNFTELSPLPRKWLGEIRTKQLLPENYLEVSKLKSRELDFYLNLAKYAELKETITAIYQKDL